MTIQERKDILVNALKGKISQSVNPPSGMDQVIYSTVPKAKVLFYGFKTSDIKMMQNKFRLTDEATEAIRVAPFLKDGGSVGFINSQIELKLYGDLSTTLNEYQKTIGTVFKDGDNSYLALIDIKVQINLKIKSKRIEYEDCHTVFLFFKSCDTKVRFEKLAYNANEINTIKESAKYYAEQEVRNHIHILEDKNIQIYISEGNSIFSNDGRFEFYVGNFAACAIGSPEAMKSLIDPRKIYYSFNGEVTSFYFGNYITYCENKREDCDKVYSGMDVYKLNFLFNVKSVKATSSVDGRKELIDAYKKIRQTYELIVYSDGQLRYRRARRTFFSTKTKGEAPFSIDISNKGEFILSDNKNTILYKSEPWKKYPTIKLTLLNDGRRYEYLNGFPGGSYSIPIEQFSIEVRDYPGIYIRYFIKTDNNANNWIQGSDGQFIRGRIKAFKAYLYGVESNKFKVCYKILELFNGRTGYGWTRPVCDDTSTESAMFEKGSYAVAMNIFVQDKDDNILL